MNSFDRALEYVFITQALKEAFAVGKTRKVRSTYFEITVFKKGTIHPTFLNEDILRRFNVTACKGKYRLPHDYGGQKSYADMPPEEQRIIDEFEGEKS